MNVGVLMHMNVPSRAGDLFMNCIYLFFLVFPKHESIQQTYIVGKNQGTLPKLAEAWRSVLSLAVLIHCCVLCLLRWERGAALL